MTQGPGTLHMVFGKIGSGKSTLAAKLAAQPSTVLISQDHLLSTLFGDVLETPRDFVRCTAKIHAAFHPHIAALLTCGTSVVLDFAANRVVDRQWMRSILDATGAPHALHVLDVPDAVCLARLRARNAQGNHPFQVSEAQFHDYMRYVEPPQADEGFDIVRHQVDAP